MKILHLLIVVMSLLWMNPIQAQTPIGGIINTYTSISNINNGTDCSATLTLVDASGFSVGDYALVIQMQGAVIDESNSQTFGDVNNLNGAGLFEKIEIASINGNTITTVSGLLNDYETTGKVQLVTIPQYMDVTVTSEITAAPWDGEKGGVIAMEVSGSLALQADINASTSGFRGGTTSNPTSECSAFTFISDFHYPQGAWQSEGKGEGVAAYIQGKEYGRGAQANGGGGGNDHNAGGGGGAGYENGGQGGENQDPGLFNCRGNFPGVGGKSISYSDTRLFLGGGGGAGHENNSQATFGGVGGGIIYCAANTITTNGFFFRSNGEDNGVTVGLDGGGGGGGAGSMIVRANMIIGNLDLEAKGGKGSDTRNLNIDRCMGPGGGGGGGAIYSNVDLAMMTPHVQGGLPGVVTESISGCNGLSNNAASGQNGAFLGDLDMPFNPGANAAQVDYSGCSGDGYSIMVNGTTYDESNPLGVETMVNQYGCDSVIAIDLSFAGLGTQTINQMLCWDESFIYNGTEYNINNPTGQAIIGTGANGCDSIVSINLTFSPEMVVSESQNGDEVTINVAGGTPPLSYTWNNGLSGPTHTLTQTSNYTVTVMDALGCSKEYTFFFIVTSNEEVKLEYGLEVFPNPVADVLNLEQDQTEQWQVSMLNIAGQEMLSEQWQGSNLRLDVSQLPSGIYFLRMETDKVVYTERIIIR